MKINRFSELHPINESFTLLNESTLYKLDFSNLYSILGDMQSLLYVKIYSEDDIKKLTYRLVTFLEEIKENIKDEKIDEKDIEKLLSKLEKKAEGQLIIDLNLDSFFRGVSAVSIKKKKIKDRINRYFDEYMTTIESKIRSIFDEMKKSTRMDVNKNTDDELDEDDDFFNEVKELKKDLRMRMSRKDFEKNVIPLQIELLKLQEWLKKNQKRVVLLFEGRDSAGKGSTIKLFTEYLNPKYVKVATFDLPTEHDKKFWFERYEKELPKPGYMTLYDRSWYNRAVVEPVMGYCTENEYKDFMEKVVPFEEKLMENEIYLFKLWFSISRENQLLRFKMRKANPLKYWKYSANDENSIDKWDNFTVYKEQMFERTSTEKCPWIVVDANDRRIAQLNTIKYILNKIPYDGKIKSLINVQSEIVYEL